MTIAEASVRIRDMAEMLVQVEPQLIEFCARTMVYMEKLTAFLDPQESLSPAGLLYMEEMDSAFDLLLGSLSRTKGGAA